MTEQPATDPSMDEILASIRRIISDDETLPAGKPSEDRAGDEVLVLTERAPAAVSDGSAGDSAATPDHDWVGEHASRQAASAFGQLSDAVDQAAPPSLAMPAAGRSLEDVTRDLLRPLLKSWLDEHLPAIVQARVDEEVSRIARARLR